jgi:hypothetical protein
VVRLQPVKLKTNSVLPKNRQLLLGCRFFALIELIVENIYMPQIKFIIDKELDFENHLIGLKCWENKLHSRAEGNEYLKKLSGKSRAQ